MKAIYNLKRREYKNVVFFCFRNSYKYLIHQAIVYLCPLASLIYFSLISYLLYIWYAVEREILTTVFSILLSFIQMMIHLKILATEFVKVDFTYFPFVVRNINCSISTFNIKHILAISRKGLYSRDCKPVTLSSP